MLFESNPPNLIPDFPFVFLTLGIKFCIMIIGYCVNLPSKSSLGGRWRKKG